MLGPASISFTLLVMGILSQRLGRAIHARPYYFGFYLAAGCIALAVGVRIVNLGSADMVVPPENTIETFTELTQPMVQEWTVLYNGLLALGVTIGLVVAWFYWSWLLAERD